MEEHHQPTWLQRVFLEDCDPSTRSDMICCWGRRQGCTTAMIEFVKRQVISRSNIYVLFVLYNQNTLNIVRGKLERSIGKELIRRSHSEHIQLINDSIIFLGTSTTIVSIYGFYPNIIVYDSGSLRNYTEICARFIQTEFKVANFTRQDSELWSSAGLLPKVYELSEWSRRKFYLYLIFRKLFKDGDLVRRLVMSCE
jgi:hypothetical protein